MPREDEFNPESVDVITFDLDDTLWDNSQAVLKAESLLLAKLHQEFPKTRNYFSNEALAQLKDRIYRDYGIARGVTFLRTQWLSIILERSGYSAQQTVGNLMAYFIFTRSQVDLLPNVEATLTRLRQRYRLFALTNGNVDLHVAGVENYFEGVINPDKIQRAKPDPAFFKVAEAHIGTEARRILHVGDGWKNDVLAARAVGFQTAWFNPEQISLPESGYAAFQFHNWSQFF